MYHIDWNKYLSSARLRQSLKEEERINQPDDDIDKRSPFESDFGRVVFSSAARRMHDKTQVFPLNTDDNIHTRLTHSIEVMNIGYSIGVSLTRNKQFIEAYKHEANSLAWQICAILKTACFIHDIGNPPFGHFGEDAIKTYFDRCFNNCRVESNSTLFLGNGQIVHNLNRKAISQFFEFVDSDELYDFVQFDGNAEGYRIITKLQYLDDLYGLNLSSATLAAYLKYPNTGCKDKSKDAMIYKSKHGVFYTEKELLGRLAGNCGLFIDDSKTIKRHPLSYLVEAADSICYLSMDIEDSISKSWHTLDSLKRHIGNSQVISMIDKLKLKNQDGKDIPHKKLVVDFRVSLINYFVSLAVNNFICHLEEIDKGNYNKELIRDDEHNVAKDLGEFCKQHIFMNPEIMRLELAGDSIIKSLLDHYMYLLLHKEKDYINRARATIPTSILNTVIREFDNGVYATEEFDNFKLEELPLNYRFRIIRDHVAMMTDKYAMNLNNQLNGQHL